jgi:hypothetical protein
MPEESWDSGAVARCHSAKKKNRQRLPDGKQKKQPFSGNYDPLSVL